MRVVTHIVFDQDEQVVFGRLLGVRDALGWDDDGKARLGRFLARALPSAKPVGGKASEPFDRRALEAFEEAMVTLYGKFQPQTAVEWWVAAGAPTPENSPGLVTTLDAVEGLAQQRRHDLESIGEALEILGRALALIPDTEVDE